MACAGDQLIYEVTLTDLRSEGAVVAAKAFLNGELLAEAEIVFAHLDNSRANQIFGPKNFVFTQQLLGVLDLAKAQQQARARRIKPRTGRPSPTDSRTTRGRSVDPTTARAGPITGSAGINSPKVCEKFECYGKFMPPSAPVEAIIVKRIDRSEHLRAWRRS